MASYWLGAALPPDRPMWIAHFIEDFNDTHSAVVWRLHHVIGDGISVAHMCFNMFNTAEDLQGMGATLHVPTAPRAARLDESTSKVAQKVWCGEARHRRRWRLLQVLY
jgi:ABC-type Zn2+ transport system substrate-binding protein/surface adhesin